MKVNYCPMIKSNVVKFKGLSQYVLLNNKIGVEGCLFSFAYPCFKKYFISLQDNNGYYVPLN